MYRESHRGPGVTRFLSEKTGFCPGCKTHVSWVGVPIFPGMGDDLRRLEVCSYRSEHQEMKEALIVCR